MMWGRIRAWTSSAPSNFLDPAGDGRVVMGQVFDASKGLLPW